MLGLLLLGLGLLHVGAAFECPFVDGVYGDPLDCSKYYMCGNWVPYHQSCRPNIFDEVILTCVDPTKGDCGDRPGPGTTLPPTTPHTPTTRKPIPPLLPDKIVGLYTLLADDDWEGFDSNATWTPLLYEWQQTNANVLFFTFIHPGYMTVPLAFQKLAASRGTGEDGAVPADTIIMFAIGGAAYSTKPNPWPFLTSKQAAEAMAEEVATWSERYGCDGIDLDIEDGAGTAPGSGNNLIAFIKRIKDINPNFIITQPTYGSPQISSEIAVINHSWNVDGSSNYLAESIGIMVYEGTQALDCIELYTKGSETWTTPVKINVPTNAVVVGSKGTSSSSVITSLANACVQQDLKGIMVWFASVRNGLIYQHAWDASGSPGSIEGYGKAMELFRKQNN